MERDSPPQLPLGHKLIAVIIAAAVAGGVYFWLSRNAIQSASTAELSFDPAAAQRIDPGVVGSTEPAVAVAQSMLSDQAVAALSKQAFLSSSSMAARVGEFRARLDLTEPSTNVLRVQFRDADPAKAAGTANAIAKALAAGIPTTTTAPPAPVATPQPAPQPAKPSPQISTAPRADHSLSDSLAELATLLASTNRKLDNMGAPAGKSKNHHRQYAGESASYTLARQQQLLKAQVRTAQKQLSDTRSIANHDSIPGAKDRLAEIQEELTSILPGRAGSRFNGAGVDSGQMRRERAQLVRTIGVVEKARVAIRRQEDARSTPAPNTAESTTPSAPASNAAPAPAPQPQPAPVDSSANAGQQPQSPLRLVRAAGTAAHPLWWPPVLGGLLAGLLYLGIAALRYRHHETETDYSDGSTGTTYYGNRLITPDAPVSAADFSQHRVFKDLLETPPETRPQQHPSPQQHPRPADSAPPPSPEEHLAPAAPDSPSKGSSAGLNPLNAVPEQPAPENALASEAAEPAVAEHASLAETHVDPAADPAQRIVTGEKPGTTGEEVGTAGEQDGIAGKEVAIASEKLVAASEEVAAVGKEAGVSGEKLGVPAEKHGILGEKLAATREEVAIPGEQVAVAGEEVGDPETEVDEHDPEPAVAATEPVVTIREAEPRVADRQTVSVLEALPAMPLFAERDAPRVNGGPGPASISANLVGMPDPWTDQIRKALSQTTIGRMFEGTLTREEKSEARRDDTASSSDQSDRLAG